jgi:uncharacterized delta-60 repeat protein
MKTLAVFYRAVTTTARNRLSAALGACVAIIGMTGVAHADPGNFLVRYDATGHLDSSFGGGGIDMGNVPGDDVLTTAGTSPFNDGTITAVGFFNSQSGTPRHLIVGRYLANGSPDTSFGFGGVTTAQQSSTATDEYAWFVGFQPSHQIIVAGTTTTSNVTRVYVARFNWNGSLDTNFGRSGFNTVFHTGNVNVSGLVITADGSILVAAGNGNQCSVARFTADGSRDLTWGESGGTVSFNVGPNTIQTGGLTTDTSGRIYVACNDNAHVGIARYSAAGVLDTTYGSGGVALLNYPNASLLSSALTSDSSNRVVMVGSTFNGAPANMAVTRLTTSGGIDSSFGRVTVAFSGKSAIGSGVKVQRTDGKIVIGGWGYINPGSFAQSVLAARLTTTGGLDSTYGSGGRVVTNLPGGNGPSTSPGALSLDPSNRVLIVGGN